MRMIRSAVVFLYLVGCIRPSFAVPEVGLPWIDTLPPSWKQISSQLEGCIKRGEVPRGVYYWPVGKGIKWSFKWFHHDNNKDWALVRASAGGAVLDYVIGRCSIPLGSHHITTYTFYLLAERYIKQGKETEVESHPPSIQTTMFGSMNGNRLYVLRSVPEMKLPSSTLLTYFNKMVLAEKIVVEKEQDAISIAKAFIQSQNHEPTRMITDLQTVGSPPTQTGSWYWKTDGMDLWHDLMADPDNLQKFTNDVLGFMKNRTLKVTRGRVGEYYVRCVTLNYVRGEVTEYVLQISHRGTVHVLLRKVLGETFGGSYPY